jgi:hypothetical protein
MLFNGIIWLIESVCLGPKVIAKVTPNILEKNKLKSYHKNIQKKKKIPEKKISKNNFQKKKKFQKN